MIEVSLIFAQSFLEVMFFISIVKTINVNAKLGIIKAIIYSSILASIATVMDVSQLSYHFAFSIIASIALYLLLKRPARVCIVNYVIDLLIGFVILSVIQLIITGIVGLFSINILGHSYVLIVILIVLIFLFERLSLVVSIHAFFEKHYMANRITIIFAIISVLFLITIVFEIILYREDLFSIASWGVIILVIIGYFTSTLFFGVSLVRMRNIKKEKAAVLEYGELLQNIVNAYRKTNHNFKHHLQMIVNLNQNSNGTINNSELNEYIEGIIDGHNYIGDTSIVKDDVLISAMLHQKKGYARQQNISFSVRILSFLSEYKLPNIELIDILVNLIDNAFEAVEKLDSENRVVYLDFDEQKIEIRNKASIGMVKNNSLASDRVFEEGYSTKGSERGFGLSNVLSTAERYSIKVQNDIEGEFVIFRLEF